MPQSLGSSYTSATLIASPFHGLSMGKARAYGQLTVTRIQGLSLGSTEVRGALSVKVAKAFYGGARGTTEASGRIARTVNLVGRSTGTSDALSGALRKVSLTGRSLGDALVSSPAVVPPISLSGDSVGYSRGVAALSPANILQGNTEALSMVSAALTVVQCDTAALYPLTAAPNDLMTITGTLLNQIIAVQVLFDDGQRVVIPSSQFLPIPLPPIPAIPPTDPTTEILFLLPAHPTDPFYVGPATIVPIANKAATLQNFLIAVVCRPVMIEFVGGPHDHEITVTQGVRLDQPTHIYSDYGTYRSGQYGVAIWADYQYEGNNVPVTGPPSNMLNAEDSSFEGGTPGDWVGDSNVQALTSSTDWASAGTHSLKIAPARQMNEVDIVLRITGLQPNTTYTFTCDAYITGPVTYSPQIQCGADFWMDVNGNWTGNQYADPTNMPAGQTFHYSASLTSPANTAQADWHINFNLGVDVPNPGVVPYVDNISFQGPDTIIYPKGMDPANYAASYEFEYVIGSQGNHDHGPGGLAVITAQQAVAPPTTVVLNSVNPSIVQSGQIVVVNGGGLLNVTQLDLVSKDGSITSTIPVADFVNVNNAHISFVMPPLPFGTYDITATTVDGQTTNALEVAIMVFIRGLAFVSGQLSVLAADLSGYGEGIYGTDQFGR